MYKFLKTKITRRLTKLKIRLKKPTTTNYDTKELKCVKLYKSLGQINLGFLCFFSSFAKRP